MRSYLIEKPAQKRLVRRLNRTAVASLAQTTRREPEIRHLLPREGIDRESTARNPLVAGNPLLLTMTAILNRNQGIAAGLSGLLTTVDGRL